MVWIKRLAIVIGVVLALIIGVIAYVMIFVNPNDFKGEIQKVALEKADVRLRMDGDIHWSFFPRFGLTLSGIGVAMGKDPEILQFDRAEFGLAILPLLKRSIQVDTVELVNLKANLSVDKNGRGNWQRSQTAVTPNKTASSSLPNASANTATSSNMSSGQVASASSANDPLKRALPDLHLDKLIIKNADIHYQDAAKDQRVNAVVNLELNDVQWDKAWPMAMNLVVKQSDFKGNHPLSAEIKLDADLTVFPEREAFSLSNVDFTTNASGDMLPTSPLNASLKASQVDMDIPQETLTMDGMVFSALGLSVNATLQSYQVLSDPEYNGVFSIAQFNPRDVMKRLNIALPAMADDKALTSAQASFTVQGNKDTVMVQPMSFILDGSTIKASAGADLSPLRWDVNIAGADLNLDRYLPPVDEKSKQTNADASKVTFTTATGDSQQGGKGDNQNSTAPAADLIPVELIRSLEGHVGLALKNVTLKKMKLDKVVLDATVANGLVRIAPAMVDLYQGKAEVKASLDVRGNTPKMSITPQVNGVQIQPLLQDYMAMNKLKGATFMDGELTAQGNQFPDLMSSLQGDLLVTIKKGALVGMNITKTVCKGIAAVRKESINEKDFGADTPFESLSFPAHIVDGRISTPGLKISSAGLQVTGDGVISLPDESLDYQANVAIGGSEIDHACRVNDKITNLAFPIVCKGGFSDDPAGLCRPDLKKFGGLFADLAKQELKDKVATEKEKLKQKLKDKRQSEEDKLKEKLKDKLKNLF